MERRLRREVRFPSQLLEGLRQCRAVNRMAVLVGEDQPVLFPRVSGLTLNPLFFGTGSVWIRYVYWSRFRRSLVGAGERG
jgi:hypothetical protein